jgi:hypothetical protein
MCAIVSILMQEDANNKKKIAILSLTVHLEFKAYPTQLIATEYLI